MAPSIPLFQKFSTNAHLASGEDARPGKGDCMRTQKRFTPALLERYKRIGRGTGTHLDYLPWHRVGRSDPSSHGRSHLMVWRERQYELLSDGEWDGLLFATMLDNVEDGREQHRLALDDGPFELADYDIRFAGQIVPGTLSIAKKLGIRHPRVNGNGRSDDWVMTTDQVLVLKSPRGRLSLLAVAYKPDSVSLTKRSRQLLAIEKAYWDVRGVQWLLITPELFDESVALTLRRNVPWGLGTLVAPTALAEARRVVDLTLGHTYTFTVDTLASTLGDKDTAQRALWQSVWTGAIPMELRIGWRPHLPIQLISSQNFLNLNPVASRRSAWN